MVAAALVVAAPAGWWTPGGAYAGAWLSPMQSVRWLAGTSGSGPGALRLRIDVIGAEHRWHYRYAAANGVADALEERWATGDLHVPADTHVELVIHSEDKLYFFGIPSLALSEVTMRAVTNTLNVPPQPVGSHALAGDQLCSGAYPEMEGALVVESWPAFRRWLAAQPGRRPPPGAAADG